MHFSDQVIIDAFVEVEEVRFRQKLRGAGWNFTLRRWVCDLTETKGAAHPVDALKQY